MELGFNPPRIEVSRREPSTTDLVHEDGRLLKAITNWREVADLASDEIPEAGLTTILSAMDGEGIEPVDPDRRLYRVDGEVMRVHPLLAKIGETSR